MSPRGSRVQHLLLLNHFAHLQYDVGGAKTLAGKLNQLQRVRLFREPATDLLHALDGVAVERGQLHAGRHVAQGRDLGVRAHV